ERLRVYWIRLLLPRAVLEFIHRLSDLFSHVPCTAFQNGLTLVRRDVHRDLRVGEQPMLCFNLMKPFEQLALPCENQIEFIHELSLLSLLLVLGRFVEPWLRRP